MFCPSGVFSYKNFHENTKRGGQNAGQKLSQFLLIRWNGTLRSTRCVDKTSDTFLGWYLPYFDASYTSIFACVCVCA